MNSYVLLVSTKPKYCRPSKNRKRLSSSKAVDQSWGHRKNRKVQFSIIHGGKISNTQLYLVVVCVCSRESKRTMVNSKFNLLCRSVSFLVSSWETWVCLVLIYRVIYPVLRNYKFMALAGQIRALIHVNQPGWNLEGSVDQAGDPKWIS